MSRTPAIAAAALGAGAILAFAAPLAASAHVTVDPGTAEAGSYATIEVNVPNESDTTATNKLTVSLPADQPMSYVAYTPVPGWTVELGRETLPEPVEVDGEEITEAVTSVTWTAQPGSELGPGTVQMFPLTLGPVPDVDSLVLPAVQTYTDGEVVAWDQTEADAAKPAPVLYVNETPPADGHSDDGDAAGEHSEAEETLDADAASATGDAAGADVLARVLGILGLVVGAAGVVIAVLSRRAAADHS